MGEMAEDAWAEWLIENHDPRHREQVTNVERWLTNNAIQGERKQMAEKRVMYTEEVLNRDKWITAQGEILEVGTMDKDHLRNVLMFLHKRRNFYWLNCKDASLIEKFYDGDDFFQRVIRKSTLWTKITEVLSANGITGFNFEIDNGEARVSQG